MKDCPAKFRPHIARMVHIKQRILAGPRPGQRLNYTILGLELEVTPKTVYRDVTFMRDRLGHEIIYDQRADVLRYVKFPEPVL